MALSDAYESRAVDHTASQRALESAPRHLQAVKPHPALELRPVVDPFAPPGATAAVHSSPLALPLEVAAADRPLSQQLESLWDDEFWDYDRPTDSWKVSAAVLSALMVCGVVGVAALLAVFGGRGPSSDIPAQAQLPANASAYVMAQTGGRAFPPLSGVLRSDGQTTLSMRGYLHGDGVVCAEVRVGRDMVDSMCAPRPDAQQVVGSEPRDVAGLGVTGQIRVSGATVPHVVAFTLGDQTSQHAFCPGADSTVWLERGQQLDCLDGANLVTGP